MWQFLTDTLNAVNPANQGITKSIKDAIESVPVPSIVEPVVPTCSYYDTLCQYMGVESGWSMPQWFQDKVELVSKTTGLSPEAATIALPTVTTALALGTVGTGIYGINKLRKKAEKILSPEVLELFKDNVEAMEFFKEMKKTDPSTLKLINENPAVAAHLLDESKDKGVIVLKAFQKVPTEQRAKAFGVIAQKRGLQLVGAPIAEVTDAKDAKEEKKAKLDVK